MDFGDSTQTFIIFVSVLGFLILLSIAIILLKKNARTQERESNIDGNIRVSRPGITESRTRINDIGDFPEDYIDPLPLYMPRISLNNGSDYTNTHDASHTQVQMQSSELINESDDRPPTYTS